MKKLSLLIGLLALAFSLPLHAEESKAGGLEFSGNVDVVTGWQHDNGASYSPGGFPGSGQLGDFRGSNTPNRDTFNFYLDQVELDLNKSFGNRIRLRADLEFGRVLSGTSRVTESPPAFVNFGNPVPQNFNLEQAYVTVGIPGNGELAFGRFNAPVGYYVVDRADNPTISFSNIYQFVTPTNVTGMKAYWAFGDHFDYNLYVVNQLYDCLFTTGCLTGPSVTAPPGSGLSGNGDSAIPSWGMRFGYNFGGEKKKSTVGLSYLGGPEQAGNNAHLTHILDLDFSIKATENLLIAGEGIYYQQNLTTAQRLTPNQPNNKFWGGLLVLDYAFSDTWDLFGSYGYVNDFQGALTGIDQEIHNFVIGAGYQITDGAKLKLEYRADLHFYSAVGAAFGAANFGTNGNTTALSNGLAAEFAYNF
jgi:putative OmpL-like beta-barrel porin-2